MDAASVNGTSLVGTTGASAGYFHVQPATNASCAAPGTYAGTNGTLGLDVTLGATPVTDPLILGGVASGTT